MCHSTSWILILGHGLGLQHTEDFDAVMYSIHKYKSNDKILGDDDINGIQYIYGKKLNNITSPCSFLPFNSIFVGKHFHIELSKKKILSKT